MHKPIGQLGGFDRERLQAILDAAVDAIITIDIHGTILDANPATSSLLGYERRALIGAHVSILMDRPHAQRHDDYVARYLSSGVPHIIGVGGSGLEVEARHQDGHLVPVTLTVGEVVHGGEHLFTGILRDATAAVARRLELELSHNEMSVQLQINQVLQRALQVDDLLDGVLRALVEIADADESRRAGAWLVDRQAGVLHLGRTIGDCSTASIAEGRTVLLGQGLCGRAVATGKVFMSEDCHGTPFPEHCAPGGAAHGHYIFPLRAQGEVLGVVSLCTKASPRWDERRRALFETLGMQIGGTIRRIRVEEELRASRRQLIEIVTRDPLTGALNRRAIRERLADELARVKRVGEPLAVVMADLDLFKQVNDTYGHLAGDEVLVEVVRRMATVLRPYDACSRYGGEEFLILLPGASIEEGAEVAERLRQAIARGPILGDGHLIEVRVSAGVASVSRGQPLDADSLVRRADEALYRAKRGGRDRIELAPVSAD